MTKLELLISSIHRRGLYKTLRYVCYELAFDIRYGTDTGAEIGIYSPSENDIEGFIAPCQGVNPWIVNKCFNQLRLLNISFERSTFLDIGSGKGRAMLIAEMVGFKKIIGVELCSRLCDVALKNFELCSKSNQNLRYVMHNQDAAYYVPPADANVIFLYNPFGCKLVRKIIDNLMESYDLVKRDIYVIYVNPVCAQAFIQAGFDKIAELGDEAIIYRIEA